MSDQVRVVTVGEPGIGKTTAHVAGLGQDDSYVPSRMDPYDTPVDFEKHHFKFCVQEAHIDEQQRAHHDYLDVQYVVCMYDISQPDTLAALEQKWIPECLAHKTQFVIVGLKCDLRAEDGNTCVPLEGFDSGKALYNKFAAGGKCLGYLETSLEEGGMTPVLAFLASQQGARLKEVEAGEGKCCVVQ